jgi:hypothetical protein
MKTIGSVQQFVASAAIAFFAVTAVAQSPQLQEKLAEIKQAQATNKQKLAQYSWQEQETISIKGEVKDTKIYQVHMGPGGQQKTEINNEPAKQGGREGRLKKRVVEHVTDEYQQYGQQIAALAHQYTPPDPQKLEQAYKQGNVSLQSGGAPNEVSLIIKNYVKPNDSMTLVFDRQAKAITGVTIASYLNDPGDAVKISTQFGQLPDGTNHVSNMTVDGVSKHLTVAEQTSNYQKM